MGEKLGFISVLLLFSITLLPFGLNAFITQTEATKLLIASNEVKEVVSAEGGVTNRVSYMIDRFEEQGLDISLTDNQGRDITGMVNPGDVIVIHYDYRNFNMSNNAVVLTR